jgi:N-acyl-D-aspartate/D-glutamate deacylase
MMSRQLNLGVLLALLLVSAPTTWADEAVFERVFRRGLIVDGSGGEPYIGAVGIRHGRLRIRAGDAPDWRGEREHDISGKVIAPGLIDLHTHARADLLDAERSSMTHYLTQGVTTVVIGNDGDGTIKVADRFERFAEHGTGTHVVQYVGHGALRRAVMPRTDRTTTAAELAQMIELLEQAMREGAAGLSSGLFYADGTFATTEEVIALCRVVARRGGIYDSHIRAESSRGIGLLGAVDEAIEIGRESGIPVHIAHVKALGRDVWGQAPAIVERVEAARSAGVQVTADQYPWVASSTQLKSAVLSKEFQAGGVSAWRERLADPTSREPMLSDMRDNIHRRGGPESLLLLEASDPRWNGLRLNEVAAALDLSAEEAAALLIGSGTPRVVSFNMQEDDIAVFMRQPWVATSSDGTNGHPRKYGSFPRKYQRYVQQLGVIDLPQFVRSSSGLAADILGLTERGYLRDDFRADVLVLDPERYRERADFENWDRLSEGVEYLFVEGVAVIEQGKLTGERPGTALRRAVSP